MHSSCSHIIVFAAHCETIQLSRVMLSLSSTPCILLAIRRHIRYKYWLHIAPPLLLLPQDRELILPVLNAHCITAGISISPNKSVKNNILPEAPDMKEWGVILYRWQFDFVELLRQDVRSLG